MEISCPKCWPAAMQTCEAVFRDVAGRETFVGVVARQGDRS
jgi:hypothetical protein